MTFLLAWLGACNGCRPQLPYPNDDDTRTDSANPNETGDSVPEETGPPPMCEVEEVEPNNSVDAAQDIPMHAWACGHFDAAFDSEWLRFEADETGWLEVQVEAASRGSSADAQLDLVNETTSDSLHISGRYLSSDPLVVFPLSETGVFDMALGETQYLYGDAYAWYTRAAIVKAPIEWTANEAEGNDTFDVANPFTVGDTLFGTISAPDDFDWYKIELDGLPTQFVFNVVAYELGSPADIEIKLYEADGTTLLRTDKYGEIDYDPDPYMSVRSTSGDMAWYLLVRTQDDKGSPYHWYTLTITSTALGL